MKGKEDHLFAQAHADREWWQKLGNHLDLTVISWTFQDTAQFMDNRTGQMSNIDGFVAKRILELLEK